MLVGWEGNHGPGGKYWQPTAGFMASVTGGLTAKDWGQLWNPTIISSTCTMYGHSVKLTLCELISGATKQGLTSGARFLSVTDVYLWHRI